MGIHQGGISDTTVDPGRLLQVGDIIMSGNSAGLARAGFLLCDGSAVSRVTYSDLFNEIGVTFGPGDGATTFNIPDFRSRSPIGVGQGTGLSSYVMAQTAGEENHILTVAELATHTHLQNSHNHTQDAHTHTQDAHTHTVTDPGHNHTQNSHNHTQDAHTHTQNAHTHTQNAHQHITATDSTYTAGVPCINVTNTPNQAQIDTGTQSRASWNTIATNQNTTATNQNTTATNQATTATNISNTTGVTNQNTTATNQNTTATNQAATAVNQNEGGGGGHNTIHPVLTVVFMIKF